MASKRALESGVLRAASSAGDAVNTNNDELSIISVRPRLATRSVAMTTSFWVPV